MKRNNKKKEARYLGQIIRELCPSLYGEPVYDENGNYISYKIEIPLIAQVSVEELLNG